MKQDNENRKDKGKIMRKKKDREKKVLVSDRGKVTKKVNEEKVQEKEEETAQDLQKE